MMRTISEHQAKVYEYAKSQGERWFTIQELSTEANLPDASGKSHATRFEEAGVFEKMRISPNHVFRPINLSSWMKSRGLMNKGLSGNL